MEWQCRSGMVDKSNRSARRVLVTLDEAIVMDLIEYIESLPEKQIGQLYGSASICRVVLQQLPALASQYIKRLLLINGGVPEGKNKACIADAQGWALSVQV